MTKSISSYYIFKQFWLYPYLNLGLLRVKLNEEGYKKTIGEFQIAKAVIGNASIMIVLTNSARIEMPYYLVKFFESKFYC